MKSAPFEEYVRLGGEVVFLRRTEIDRERHTLLFVHGLGESGLCFAEAFEQPALQGFNLVAPDNIGYGRSSRATDGDYSFETHIRRLQMLLHTLGLVDVTLVGHSLGGMLVTIWAATRLDASVRRVINIDGNLTASDVTFSKRICEAFDARNCDYARWSKWAVEDFMGKFILDELGKAWPESCYRYYASLWLARPDAIIANSREIVDRSTRLAPDGLAEIGSQYKSIRLPTMYYHASSTSKETVEFVQKANLRNRGFTDLFHWPMIDRPPEFYSDLAEFIQY